MEKINNKYKDILDLSYLTKEYLLYEYLCDENDINLLFQKIGYLFRHSIDNNIETEKKYLSNLDKIKKELYLDLATYMINDPSCNKEEEVVLCYPGYQALIFYRIAHLLFVMGYKLAARIIAEDAHSKTGVDIHPGATIDKGVFIDHGTGVVIGETSIIETGVKIYQGVTLGASNLSKGYLLKGVKRHPTIKKNVTLYADCKIIGGETIIDENSVIGAGVVINNSIDKNKIVSMETKLIIKDVT